jgi:hypothetical protein
VSSRKIVYAISLGSVLALIAGLIIGSEVRAGGPAGLDPDDLPLAAAVSQDALDQAGAFDGEYVFAGGQKERDGVDAAIETSVAAVSPLVRNLGRKRLRETNPVPKKVSITTEGDAVEILLDGKGHSAKLDGTPVKFQTAQDGKSKITHGIRGSKLVEFIDGTGGDRLNEFKLNKDGSRLTMKVKITSSHLPVPVEYRLTFKRK